MQPLMLFVKWQMDIMDYIVKYNLQSNIIIHFNPYGLFFKLVQNNNLSNFGCRAICGQLEKK